MRVFAIACIWLGTACGSQAERGQSDKARAGLKVAYEIDLDKAVDDRTSEVQRDLEAALAEQNIAASVRASVIAGALTVTPSDGANKLAIEQLVKANYRDVVERRACEPSADPSAICIKISASYAEALKKAALGNAVRTIRARLDAVNVANPTVVEQGAQIVVELPAADPNQIMAMRSLIARVGKLELKVVDDGSEYMKRVFAHVGSSGSKGEPTDASAITAEIRAEVDQWQPEDGTARRADFYLIAHDREALLPLEHARNLGCPTRKLDNGKVRCTVYGRQVIEQYLTDLSMKDPSFKLPDDRQIGYELVEPEPGAKDARPHWRTYYLERAVRLAGSAIANAEGSYDPTTKRPMVLLEFNRNGARVFGDLTAQIAGKKLAIILDGRIKSAPVINGAIRGGRAVITMGGNDPRRQEAERDELVNVLKTGSLPAPLRESSVSELP